MPCFSIQTTSVKLENKEPATLAEALRAMGYRVRVLDNGLVNFNGPGVDGTYFNGELVYSGSLDIIKVKQSYAAEIIKATYSDPKWELTWGTDADGNPTVEAEYQSSGW